MPLPGHNFQNAYTYDAASNRTSLTAPDTSITIYGYDTLNRLNGLANSWAGSFGFSVACPERSRRNALSRRTQLTRPNGVNTSYGYDSVSHLLSVLHQAGVNTLDGATYAYDPAGNRTSKTNYLNGVTSNYGCDPLYELTQVTQGTSTTESYSYDAVGNRLSSSGVPNYSYNSSNELTSNSNGSYTYDANGNTLSDASGKSYTWDFENRLTQAVVPGTGGGTTTFKYDPFGRRIQKSGPLGTTNYLYDGDGLIEELDQSGTLLAGYTQGPTVDEALSMFRGGETSDYETDGLGSISSLSNTSRTLSSTYAFESFGRTLQTGSLVNPFQYTGREQDSETGLYYYRARYYNPTVGRFLSEDPIRFLGGVNFYSYVHNGSPNLRDPSGLCDEAVDVCHAQLSGRLGAVGGQFKTPHLWWWISIGSQDYIISATGTEMSWEGPSLNIHVAKGTHGSSNPDDYVGNPNSHVFFDTRDAHGGFASPEDCARVRAMLERALSYPNGMIPYSADYSSNAAAYYVGWPYDNEITNIVAPGWRYPVGWGVFLPWVDYPDYH